MDFEILMNAKNSEAQAQTPSSMPKIYFLTCENKGVYHAIKAGQASSMNGESIIQDAVINKANFQGKEELTEIVYRDHNISINLPKNLLPFESFPNLAIDVIRIDPSTNEKIKSTPQNSCCLSLVEATSDLAKNIIITCNHINNEYPPISFDIPYSIHDENCNIHDNIDFIIPSTLKWKTCFEKATDYKIVIKIINGSKVTCIFPFNKVGDTIKQLFYQQEGKCRYDSNFKLTYDFIQDKPQRPVLELSQDISFLSENLLSSIHKDKPSKLLVSILKAIKICFQSDLSDLQFDQIKNIVSDYSFKVISEYMSGIFQVPKDSINDSTSFSTWIKQNIAEPKIEQLKNTNDLDLLTCAFLGYNSEIFRDLVDTYHQTTIFTRELKTMQNFYVFGTALFYCSVEFRENMKYTMILTHGCLHFYLFGVKTPYEVLPKEFKTIQGTTKNVHRFSIPLSHVSFTPMTIEPQSEPIIGLISTSSGYFTLYFPSYEAMVNFYIMLHIAKSNMKENQICLNEPQCDIKISFPTTGNLNLYYAQIFIAGYEFNVSYPLSRFFQKVCKICLEKRVFFNTDMMISSPIPDSFHARSTSSLIFGKQFDAKSLSRYMMNDLPKLSTLEFASAYSISLDFAKSLNENISYSFFKMLKICSFSPVLAFQSLELLKIQIKAFPKSTRINLIQNSPILHFATQYNASNDILHELTNLVENNIKDNEGKSPVFKSKTYTKAQLLIDNGNDPNISDKYGNSPLSMAIDINDLDTVKFLCSHGAHPNNNLTSDHLFSALIFSMKSTKNGLEYFQKLLPYCQHSLNIPSKSGKFLTHICLRHNLFNHLLILSQCQHFNPNLFSAKYEHPMIFICKTLLIKDYDNDPRTIEALLSSQNININARDGNGMTPLCLSISLSSSSFTKRLISDYRCNLDLCDNHGRSPLYYAVVNRQIDIINFLISTNRVMIDLPTDEGETPLYHALSNGWNDIAQILLNSGANPYIWYYYGTLPIHYIEADKKEFPKLDIENKIVE